MSAVPPTLIDEPRLPRRVVVVAIVMVVVIGVAVPVRVAMIIAGLLGHAEHALDATGDAACHSTDRPADDCADRPGRAVAHRSAFGRATPDAVTTMSPISSASTGLSPPAVRINVPGQ